MQKTILIILAVIIIIAGGLWYFTSVDLSVDKGPSDDILAVVNGEEIAYDDFEILRSQIIAQQGMEIDSLDEETLKQLEDQIIDELIIQALLKQGVTKSGLTIDSEEIDEQLNILIMQIGGEEAFQEVLLAEGITKEELREQFSDELIIQKYLEERLDIESIVITDEEINMIYEQEALRNEELPDLEEIRDQIEGQLLQQKQYELFEQYIQQLKEEADIEIFA